jgi:hypothetical protein
MKKRSLLLILLTACLSAGLLKAQNLTKNDVGSVSIRNSGAIIQNDQVKGYYYFYNLEKSDRKNNNYLISITDENLREINAVNITRPNTYLLIDAVFNGATFAFLFYDMREKSLELLGYDRQLKPLGKVVKQLENKFENAAYAFIAQGNEPTQAFLIAVPNKGFLYYGIKNESKAEYEIVFYDNNLKKKWATYAEKDDFDFENAGEAFQDGDYVGSAIMKRPGMLSMDITFQLLVQNVNDGKVVFRAPMASSKYNLALAEVFFDAAKQQFLVFGEYFDKDVKVMKAESLGFIALTLDMNGKIISEKVNPWASVKKLVESKDMAKFEETDILFHDFIRTSDGEVFAVGEQYKKTGGYPMSIKINTYNMVIFQFDRDFAIKKVNVFEKDKNVFTLPKGLIMTSSKILSFIAKAYGGFDYVFTQKFPDKGTFVVNYINYDREKGQKGKNVLGSIVYTPEKVFTVDNITLSRQSSKFFVYRAKPGYIMVSEYFEKDKKLTSRLEKINY